MCLLTLQVIIQLREAALHAMKKSLKAKKDAEAFAAAKKETYHCRESIG